MKKLLILLVLLPLLAGAQTYSKKYLSTYNIWWDNYNKFTRAPLLTNSGGTVTDTLETKATVRLKLDKSTFTTYQADTVTLSTAVPAATYTLPTYADNTTALAALGAGRLYKNTSGQVFITY